MKMDISEEAKLAIANGQLIRARNRLVKDGCRTDACDHAEIAGTLLRDGRPDLCPLIVWELEEKLLTLRANWLKESSNHAE
jgi:hypothetical protein